MSWGFYKKISTWIKECDHSWGFPPYNLFLRINISKASLKVILNISSLHSQMIFRKFLSSTSIREYKVKMAFTWTWEWFLDYTLKINILITRLRSKVIGLLGAVSRANSTNLMNLTSSTNLTNSMNSTNLMNSTKELFHVLTY